MFFLEIEFLEIVVGKMYHSPKKGALSSQNVFSKPKIFMKVKGVVLIKQFFSKEKSSSDEKHRGSFLPLLRKLICSTGPKKIIREVAPWTPKSVSFSKTPKTKNSEKSFRKTGTKIPELGHLCAQNAFLLQKGRFYPTGEKTRRCKSCAFSMSRLKIKIETTRGL